MYLLQNCSQFRVVVVLKFDLSLHRGHEEDEGPQVADHGLTWGLTILPRFLASSQKQQSNFEHMEEENEWLKSLPTLSWRELRSRCSSEGSQGRLTSANAQQLAFYVRNKHRGLLLQNSFFIFDEIANAQVAFCILTQ